MKDLVMTTLSADELRSLIIDCLKEQEKQKNTDCAGQVEKVYTATEAREMLKISRTTEHTLNRKGILVPIKVGGRKRYTAEAIEKAMIEI